MAEKMSNNPARPNGERQKLARPSFSQWKKVHCLECGSINVKVSFCLKWKDFGIFINVGRAIGASNNLPDF